MRIFYAADHQPFPGNNVWHNNLYLPLHDLGHDVICFDYDLTPHFMNADPSDPKQRQFIERSRSRLEAALLEQIRAVHRQKPIDLFFSYFYSAFCRPEIIREIKRMGILTVNWYCNGSFQFHLVKEIAPAYDYCLVPEKFRLEDYRRVGAHPIYCQEAANPNIYRRHDVRYCYDVSFVGQNYGDRPRYLKALVDHGILVHTWGMGWRTHTAGWRRLLRRSLRAIRARGSEIMPELPPDICGLPVSDDEMIKIFNQTRINLGFSNVGNTYRSTEPIRQVRLRDFEVPMSGGFYLVQAFDELADFFTPGKEIVFFNDTSDLLEKVEYYLSHDQEREIIREAGWRRANEDHTWQKRLKACFEEMGLL